MKYDTTYKYDLKSKHNNTKDKMHSAGPLYIHDIEITLDSESKVYSIQLSPHLCTKVDEAWSRVLCTSDKRKNETNSGENQGS